MSLSLFFQKLTDIQITSHWVSDNRLFILFLVLLCKLFFFKYFQYPNKNIFRIFFPKFDVKILNVSKYFFWRQSNCLEIFFLERIIKRLADNLLKKNRAIEKNCLNVFSRRKQIAYHNKEAKWSRNEKL